MDKAEYHLRLEELTKCVEERDYAGALAIVENIEWRRVKSLRTLNMVADVYEANKRYRECKDILLLAYDRATIGRSILYRLVEISLKLGELEEAVDFYTEFAEVAPQDNSRFILKYKIYKARRSPIQDQIAILEEYKDREYTERWAYELALLYSKAGDQQKCVETCDDLILWFSEGKYVRKALELKQKYQPLTPIQQIAYQKAVKSREEEEKAETAKTPEPAPAKEISPEPREDSPADLEEMDQAGAAITREIPDIEELASSEPAEEEAPAEPERMATSQLPIQDLEPERLESWVQPVSSTPEPEAMEDIRLEEPHPEAEDGLSRENSQEPEIRIPEVEEEDGDQEAPMEEPTIPRPLYNEELEIPDPEPTPAEKAQRTITLSTIGQNTIPISIDELLLEETPEERRIRILNDAKPVRMNDEQRKIFTYFARVPGMDQQILEAMNGVYEHAGEHTSKHGNVAIMGGSGTGKTQLTRSLMVALCKDLQLDVAKVAHITGEAMNQKDPAKIVSKMSGGFLVIDGASRMSAETVEQLNKAMEFRTDCMILIIEDEKANMRAMMKQYPEFADKFDKVISIPIFTNDELVTFARTYATENGYKMDEMGVLALYTQIGNHQSEREPMTISQVKEMVDKAMAHARKTPKKRGKKKSGRGQQDDFIILQEKDFEQ